MVFGRGKPPEIKGLRNDERIEFFEKGVKRKKGFLKSDKLIIVITNKRALLAFEDTKEIDFFYNLPQIEAVVTDVRTFFSGTSYNYSTDKTRGTIEIWAEGDKKFWFTVDDPYGMRDKILMLQRYCTPSYENKPRFNGNQISLGGMKITNSTNTKDDTSPISNPKSEDPLAVLKIRFAKGEITKEEFEEMKKMLE